MRKSYEPEIAALKEAEFLWKGTKKFIYLPISGKCPEEFEFTLYTNYQDFEIIRDTELSVHVSYLNQDRTITFNLSLTSSEITSIKVANLGQDGNFTQEDAEPNTALEEELSTILASIARTGEKDERMSVCGNSIHHEAKNPSSVVLGTNLEWQEKGWSWVKHSQKVTHTFGNDKS